MTDPTSASTQPASIPVTLIAGDGIGPEITASTCEVLAALQAPFAWQIYRGAYRDALSGGLPRELIDSLATTGLLLKGPTTLTHDHTAFTALLRNEFDLYANVRPAWSVLSDNRFGLFDLILIRENTEGLYVGIEHYIALGDDPHAVGEATGVITRAGCLRIARFAFDYAVRQQRRKVTVVHKANILKALTGLFLETVMDSARGYVGQLSVDDRIVDACAMQLVLNPRRFDVLVTTNMFGDILADQLAGMVGGLQLVPSASIGARLAVFEPVHEALPQMTGHDTANPVGMLLAGAMLLDHVGAHASAMRLRTALRTALADPAHRTPDLGGQATTRALTDRILAAL